MKISLIIILSVVVLSCGTSPQNPLITKPVEATSGGLILLGAINLANLQSSTLTPWFNKTYDRITVDDQWVKKIKPSLKGVRIKIFMGTWCDDSQREIPHFFKLLDALEFDQSQLEMYAMSEEKTTPENFEKGLDVFNVPTIIFFKNGEEINRFVEFPVNSLESDVAKIIRGEIYTHSYE
jgi:thiol-disulfide isomerase/thioredoxin